MWSVTGSFCISLPADDIQHILLVEVVQQLERVSSTNENGLRTPSSTWCPWTWTSQRANKSPVPRWRQDKGSRQCELRRRWIPRPQKPSWQLRHTHLASSRHMGQTGPVRHECSSQFLLLDDLDFYITVWTLSIGQQLCSKRSLQGPCRICYMVYPTDRNTALGFLREIWTPRWRHSHGGTVVCGQQHTQGSRWGGEWSWRVAASSFSQPCSAMPSSIIINVLQSLPFFLAKLSYCTTLYHQQ